MTNRLLAVLCASALIAVGVVAIAEAIPQLVGSGRAQHVWVDYDKVTSKLSQRSWNDISVLGAGGVLAAVGLLLMLAGLRGGPRPIRLASDNHQVRVEIGKGAVRDLVAAAVISVEAVERVKVKAGRRRLTVRAGTAPDPPESLTKDIGARVWAQIDALAPLRRPRVKIRVAPARSTGTKVHRAGLSRNE